MVATGVLMPVRFNSAVGCYRLDQAACLARNLEWVNCASSDDWNAGIECR